MKSETALAQTRITFIGAGNMAEALARGLVCSGACPAAHLRASDISPDRLRVFADSYGIEGAADNAAAARNSDVILLAVKPQAIGEVLAGLSGTIGTETLVISLAAGIPAMWIEQALGEGIRVVRVMPNTPSLVGAGAAAIAGGAAATSADLDVAEALFRSVGVVVRVAEKDIDAVTALSGSGPAYVFYLVEAMLEAADEMDLDPGVARELAIATVGGAARLLEQSGETPAELRRRVTSKGGTTEAALRVLSEAGVGDTIRKALLAAQDRSRELSSP